MKYSDNAMCALLLCSYLGIRKDDALKPLSIGEWASFLDKVIEKDLEPKVVFDREFNWGEALSYSEDQVKRIRDLIDRGASMSFELDDYDRKGIHVVTLFDSDYPPLLKRTLNKKTSPVLYYAGDITLAQKIGIGVVGSRDIDAAGMDFAQKLVEKATRERLVIYSGGARGVDTMAETIAIANGGVAVAFLADSLTSRIKKRDTLSSIIDGRLLLITDAKPDAGFSAARAMNRNKFIYISSYGTFVVASDYNKGGTWAGASEAIRNKWGKTFVWKHGGYAGNGKLIEKGAIPYELSEKKLYDVITSPVEYEQISFLDQMTGIDQDNNTESSDAVTEDSKWDLYDLVRDHIAEHLESGLSVDKAAEQFCVTKEQINIWLERMCEEGLAECKNGSFKLK